MKVLKIIGVLLLVAGCGVLGFFAYKLNGDKKDLEANNAALQMQMSQMQNNHVEQKIETKTVYRLKVGIPSGAEITEADVEAVEIAAATYTDAFLTDLSMLPALSMKTLLKGSIVESSDLTYEAYVVDKKFTREIAFQNLPMGLRVGDYIDIRFALPNGENYNVLSHIKVEYMNGSTISIRVSEEEWMILDAVMHDATVYSNYTLLYMVRYLDPGADSSIAFYPISTDLATFVQFSPNIKDTTRLINPSLRNHIDEVLVLYTTNQNASIASAYISGLRTQFAAQVSLNAAYTSQYLDKDTGELELQDFLTGKGDSIVNDDAFTDKVDDALGSLEDSLASFETDIQ